MALGTCQASFTQLYQALNTWFSTFMQFMSKMCGCSYPGQLFPREYERDRLWQVLLPPYHEDALGLALSWVGICGELQVIPQSKPFRSIQHNLHTISGGSNQQNIITESNCSIVQASYMAAYTQSSQFLQKVINVHSKEGWRENRSLSCAIAYGEDTGSGSNPFDPGILN